MTTSTLTAEKSIREQLHDLFVQMAQRSFDHALVELNKVNFFDEVIRRVASGQDITADIPEAKQLSQVDVIAVVRLQRLQAANTVVSAWELSAELAGSFRTTARSVNVEGELIPHYDVEHLAETAEGQVRIGIKTWRRNIQVQVAGSDAAVNALNEQMTFVALIKMIQ